MSRERYVGLQNILTECGKYGCLYLCLASIAEEATGLPVDLIKEIRIGQAAGWLAKDFTCNDSLAILTHMTGMEWTRLIVPYRLFNPEAVGEDDYTIAKWVLGRTTHFRRRSWDVYDNSNTVKRGRCDEIYMYTCKRKGS